MATGDAPAPAGLKTATRAELRAQRLAARNRVKVWTPPPVEHHHAGPCGCEVTIPYVRVSKVGDRQILISPDIQWREIVRHCQLHNKRIISGLAFTDIDTSGRTFRRRSVEKAIALIADGTARSITVFKWSRWGRDLNQSAAWLTRVKQEGGRVDSATEDIDQDTAIGKLNLQLVMAIDEYQSNQIGEGWQAAHKQRRANGLPHQGGPRFGYEYIKAVSREVPARYVVCPEEGPVLRWLYEQYMDGWTAPKLADWLNANGYLTTRGGPWMAQAVTQMLDNGFGAGLLREHKPEALKLAKATGKPLSNRLSEWQWSEGGHDAVISATLWERYRERREAQAGLPPRLHGPVHALSALVFCALCTRRMSVKYAGPGNRVMYWKCKRAKLYHPGRPVTITNDCALRLVTDWLAASVLGTATTSVEDKARRAAKSPARAKTPGRTVKRINAEISEERAAIKEAVLMRARKQIDNAQFEDVKSECEDNIARLQAELAALATTDTTEGYAARLRTLAEPSDSLVIDNAALSGVIGMVIVSPVKVARSKADLAARVEIVPRWELESKQDWLASSRLKMVA